MPDTGRRRPPRVATCEDWDEETEAILPETRTSANVAVKRSEQELEVRRRQDASSKNGVDSGYASRADTLVSEPMSIRRKTNDLKIETSPAVILERDRQPYHMPQSAPIKPPSRRQSSSQAKDSTPERRPTKGRCVHEPGSCQICDHFGWHVDFTKEMPRASSMAPPQPPSPTATRQLVAVRARDDEAIPPKTRRSSSTRKQRPLSVVTPANPPQYAAQPIYAAPVFTPSGWATPVTPAQYAAPPYGYVAQPPPPPHSATPQYASYQQTYPYLEPASYQEPRSARPSRKSSPVRPVIRQGQVDPGFTGLDRVSSKDNRPTLTSHKSNRSIDQERVVMGPPPKPQPSDIVLARRPSARRSKTYHIEEPILRQQSSREPLRFDDDFDSYLELRPTTSNRGRRESPSRPPNSYRAPAVIDPRPILPRKSVSYSTPEAITKVASSKNNTHRRTTLASVPMEQKEADAEAYQQKRSNATPNLTIENLRDLNKGNTSSRSETGSSYSHKSHQSSSKDSSRGRSYTTSGAGTSITFPGGLGVSIPANYKSERPLSFNIGELTISMNSHDKEAERPREQKRIERAPSVASKASRRSIASSNLSNNDPPKKPSRRTSQLEDRSKLSRQHSRAPSTTGHTYEHSVSNVSRRQSVDFSNKYEDYSGYGA